MNNNLPKDPPNSGNGIPPPFGSNFNPHINPPDPNNPYQQSFNPPPAQNFNPSPPSAPNNPSSPSVDPNSNHHSTNSNPDAIKHAHYSDAAKHKARDSSGRFTHSEHTVSPASQSPQTTLSSTINSPQTPSSNPSSSSNIPNTSSSLINPSSTTNSSSPDPSFLPPIIEVNKSTSPSDKKYPPLFGIFMTNPVTYLKIFLKRLLKRQAVTLRIPVLVILIVVVGLGSYGAGLKTGFDYALGKLFPNFSPILHRSITAQGTIQKSSKGYYLQTNDRAKSLWLLKSTSDNLNFSDFVNQRVQIKGNLTPTPNLIEVSEVISFDANLDESPNDTESVPASQTTPSVSHASSDSSSNASTSLPPQPTNPNSSNLPSLYSGLTWEAPKNKTLTFTSGNRKIEQEVTYIESLQLNTYPSDFISYYTQQLTSSGFKQTLNSQEPNSTSITYSKANLFLTFGIKNIYSGSGDSRQLIGYKAYIEHN